MNPKRKFIFVLIMTVMLVLSGCDQVTNKQPEDQQVLEESEVAQTQNAQNIVETIVAETMVSMPTSELKAPEQATVTEGAPTSSPAEQATPTLLFTNTPALAPTLTATPTASLTLAEVSVPTNCRTGPGKIYDQVSVFSVGKPVEVVAKNASGTYWVVKNPEGQGTCWLWDKYATLTGGTADLPVWESPPTPTPPAGVTPTEVTLKVSVPTNCRLGPGIAYDKVSVLQINKTVKVVARHATADFWVIENPEGSGTCWVWGEHATFTGAKTNLPIQAPPPTPTPSAHLTPTPTPIGVTLKVSVDTNCRTGPGRSYDIVTILKLGKTANVVGQHATADFWVIENPEGSGACWVWGEYATLTGSTTSLPIWDVPPTPTPAGAVSLQVSVDTHCRTGPGKPYDIITIFRIGKTAEVIGRNAASTYWVILNPEWSPGYCWVWGNYATLTGLSSSLPVWDIPPTPTPKP